MSRRVPMTHDSWPPREGPFVVTIQRNGQPVTYSVVKSRRRAEALCARLIGRGHIASVTRERVKP